MALSSIVAAGVGPVAQRYAQTRIHEQPHRPELDATLPQLATAAENKAARWERSPKALFIVGAGVVSAIGVYMVIHAVRGSSRGRAPRSYRSCTR